MSFLAMPKRRFGGVHLVMPLALTMALSGCDAGQPSHNAPETQAPHTNRRSDTKSRQQVLAIANEASEVGRRCLQQMIQAIESATDDASADAAIRQLEAISEDLQGASFSLTQPIRIEMSTEEHSRLLKDIRSIQEEDVRFAKNLETRTFNAGKALGQNSQLSPQKKDRIAHAIQNISLIGRTANINIVRVHPASDRVTIVVKNTPGAGELGHYVNQNKTFNEMRVRATSGVHRITLAPCKDIKRFADSMNIGTVTQIDKKTRSIHMELSKDEVATLNEHAKNRKEERERLAKQRREEREQRERRELTSRVEVAVRKRDEQYSNCLQILRRITNIQSGRDGIDSLKKVRRELRSGSDNLERALDGYKRKLGTDFEYRDTTQSTLAEIQAEVDRLVNDTKLRALLARHFGQNIDATSLLHSDDPSGRHRNPAEDRSDPDYFAANLIDLTSGDVFASRDALRRLQNDDPQKLNDRQLRKEIARAIRDIAVNGPDHQKQDAVQPLVVWGGKYSVPILIKLLESNGGRGGADDIFAALAKYPTPESATAVAKYVGQGFVHEHACNCLVEMGTTAEDAVMGIAPSEDARTSRAAIIILGEVGTNKSLPLLREARRSTNRRVKQAAIEAAEKIVNRAKNETSE